MTSEVHITGKWQKWNSNPVTPASESLLSTAASLVELSVYCGGEESGDGETNKEHVNRQTLLRSKGFAQIESME